MTVQEAQAILSGCVNCGDTNTDNLAYIRLRGETCLICCNCDEDYIYSRMPQERINSVGEARKKLMKCCKGTEVTK